LKWIQILEVHVLIKLLTSSIQMKEVVFSVLFLLAISNIYCQGSNGGFEFDNTAASFSSDGNQLSAIQQRYNQIINTYLPGQTPVQLGGYPSQSYQSYNSDYQQQSNYGQQTQDYTQTQSADQ
jgi:hypothetical protein